MATLPRFFVTHSWKDLAFARHLADDLRSCGLDGFFDMYSIKPGQNISERIADGLEKCDVYVPILSHAALNSPWCKEEINAALTLSNTPGRNGRPTIIPVLVENCQDELPVFLRSRLYIDFTARYDEALHELLEQGFGLPATIPSPRVAKMEMTSGPIETNAAELPPSSPQPTVTTPRKNGMLNILNPAGAFFEARKREANRSAAIILVLTCAFIGASTMLIKYPTYSVVSLLIGIITITVAFFALYIAWELAQYGIARAIGGNGNLVTQMYLQAFCLAPFILISRIIGLVPDYKSVLLLLGGLGLLYLLILTLRATFGFTFTKAVLASTLPWVLGLIVINLLSDWYFILS